MSIFGHDTSILAITSEKKHVRSGYFVFVCIIVLLYESKALLSATGWSSGKTLAYHTGDPGSIPGLGGSSGKCESI